MTEPVYVTYFTDPLCSWSWAFEASWRRLLSEFGEALHYRYRMGGLLANWQRYQDPINHISRPAQMGPSWMQVQEQTGVPLNSELWRLNPPDSSYPASIAFKAAQTIRLDFAEKYLRRLREAAMLDARDISDRNVLIAVAQDAMADLPEQERGALDDFVSELDGPEAEAAFREDLKEVRYLEIGRFPTVIFHREKGRGLALTGYRPYAALREGLGRFAPELVEPTEQPESLPMDSLEAYVQRWSRVTLQELTENFALPAERLASEFSRLGLLEHLAGPSVPPGSENERHAPAEAAHN